MPISPNSLTTIAVLAPWGRAKSARITVVLPEPRNPVTTITGRRGPRTRRWRRPNGDASLPAKSDCGPVSEVHFEGVEPADMTVDGVDHLTLIDEHVVDVDRPAGRARRRFGDEITDLRRLVWVCRIVRAQPTVEID